MDRYVFFYNLTKRNKNILLNGCDLFFYFQGSEIENEKQLFQEICNLVLESDIDLLLNLNKQIEYLDDQYIVKFNANDFFSTLKFNQKIKTIYRLCDINNVGVFQIALKEVAYCFNHLNNPNFIHQLAIIMKDQQIKSDWFFAFSSIKQLKQCIFFKEELKSVLKKHKVDLFKIKIADRYIVSCPEQVVFDKREIISFEKLNTFSLLF